MASKADDLLRLYREKRDFETTAEPSGRSKGPGRRGKGALSFCVQKHDATRLHYDFRIEWQGVLKSWAVTRGPSLDPADKRLAVRTEDHPLDYGEFEGTIPAGQYGGGTVMLWDRGTWEPEPGTDPGEGLEAGNLKLVLGGEKMSGRWALIRMKPRGKETRENWLLIKEKDETASPGTDLLAKDRSVKSGRDMAAIAAGDETWTRPTKAPARNGKAGAPETKAKAKARAASETIAAPLEKMPASLPKRIPRAGVRKGSSTERLPAPRFREPQLATLVDEPPEGSGWIHEMKYDGYRVLIAVGGDASRLYTRNGLDWTDRFGSILPAVEALGCRSALIDGEVVAFDSKGRTDFSTLQAHLKDGGELSCFCFDLLELDGVDLKAEPLAKRKALLAALLDEQETRTLLYSEHIEGKGRAVFESVCRAGHEGIVSKRADAPYRSGRARSWLKVKCTRRQEFVVGGYSTSDKKGRAFSSLLVGSWEDGRLVYRGRVGSGFDERTLDDLAARFEGLARSDMPFEALPAPIRRGARFLVPDLVAEIDFAEITADGQIRHGVFKGLREDKPARDVTGEMPKPPKEETEPKGDAANSTRRKPAKAKADAVVAGVTLTHPEREVFDAITKKDIALYYEAIAERMLARAGGHAMSLVRCPQGPKRHCFFQKHDSGGFPEAIRKKPIAEKDGGTADYLYVADAAGLVAAVQMNALEFHVWGSPVRRVEVPDRIVFDLDPDEDLPFAAVKEAAFDLRNLLDHLGLRSFALVTGGKGLHVVVPLTGGQGWDAAKGFARDLATKLADGDPDRFVATMSKAKRHGRIFIDWLRNERGATAIAPYSTRAREGAPVAVPVSWEELGELERANGFDMGATLARLEEPDPWAEYESVRQSLTKSVLAGLAKL